MSTSGSTSGNPSSAKSRPSCSIRVLPEEQWESAAAIAADHNPANGPMLQMMRAGAGTGLSPAHQAIVSAKYWGARGVNLTVSFLDDPEPDLRTEILKHMNAWATYANVQFHEVPSGGQVRIARFTPAPDDGFWSFLGTDILSIPLDQPTMNLQDFDLIRTPESEFFRVIRHETGHTLGFPHEHMLDGIIKNIDPNKAIAYFQQKAHGGWKPDVTTAQVLTPLANSALIRTAAPDPTSIMCYQLPAEIMKNNEAVPGGRDINARDGAFAAKLYPKFTAGAVS